MGTTLIAKWAALIVIQALFILLITVLFKWLVILPQQKVTWVSVMDHRRWAHLYVGFNKSDIRMCHVCCIDFHWVHFKREWSHHSVWPNYTDTHKHINAHTHTHTHLHLSHCYWRDLTMSHTVRSADFSQIPPEFSVIYKMITLFAKTNQVLGLWLTLDWKKNWNWNTHWTFFFHFGIHFKMKKKWIWKKEESLALLLNIQ